MSPVVAAALLAVAVAAGLTYVVWWARQQTSSLPQQLYQPCPAVVQAVQNGSRSLLYAVFAGDMRGEVLYVVVGRLSAEAPAIYWEYFGSWTGPHPDWTDSRYGFDGFYSSTPVEASGTTDRIYFTDVSQMPGPVATLPRDPNRYFAMRYTVAVSPRSSATYTFTLRCVGACDALVADAVTGAGTVVVSNYGKAWSASVRTNTSTYPLYAGRVYTIVVRHVSWTQSSYLELDINDQPVTTSTLTATFYSYTAEVLAVPGQAKGVVYSSTVDGVPLLWACRGLVAPVRSAVAWGAGPYGGGPPAGGGGGGVSEGDVEGVVGGISRLYPLLSSQLKLADYIALTDRYIPVNVTIFNLTPSYRPYVRWSTGSSTRYCYDYLLYVHLTWDSSNWYVTYRKCAADGPVLETLALPRSQTTVPYREWLYNSTCVERSGIRYCFEVYAYASGRCDARCDDPPNSRWFFEVGMRVVYRFEPVDPGYKVLVVLNRTTYESTFGKGVATCTLYTSNVASGCVKCSPTADTGMCNYPPASSVVAYLLEGCRPVFWWDIRYDESWEYSYSYDDGYEEGAWYPQTSINTVFNVSASYAYAVGDSVTVVFQKYGGRVQYAGMYDYMRRLGSYQVGYYPVRFKLIYDEGGIASDARVWDYRAVVYLLKPRG